MKHAITWWTFLPHNHFKLWFVITFQFFKFKLAIISNSLLQISLKLTKYCKWRMPRTIIILQHNNSISQNCLCPKRESTCSLKSAKHFPTKHDTCVYYMYHMIVQTRVSCLHGYYRLAIKWWYCNYWLKNT